MNRAPYSPGAAHGASIDKKADVWTLVLVRDLKHPPAKVWTAITEPEHLQKWAPFDASRSLGTVGTAQLTTVGAPQPVVAETQILKADAPKLLEYTWGGQNLRWELEPTAAGTRLTLWHNINKGFISMGATGWHVCFDVLAHHLAGDPLGRIVGPDAMAVPGWQKLHEAYAQALGVPMPTWRP